MQNAKRRTRAASERRETRSATHRSCVAARVLIAFCIVAAPGCAATDSEPIKRLEASGAIVELGSETKDGERITNITFAKRVAPQQMLQDALQLRGPVWLTFRSCHVDARALAAPSESRTTLGLTFDRCTFTSGALAALDRNRSIDALQFLDSPIDDGLLAGLEVVPNLHVFYMNVGDPPPGAVRLLSRAGRLISLTITNSRLNDSALSRIVDANERLEILDVHSTAVTDAVMPNICKLRSLRRLCLNRCAITDAGLAHVRTLRRIEFLALSYTDITDSALRNLDGMQRLNELHITHTRVTNASLATLSELPDLSCLHARGTAISEAKALEMLLRVPVVVADK